MDSKFIERQIREINSKHCMPILRIVKAEDGISQGELAGRLKLLPSGLSAVIKKMESCSIPLITVSQIGKFKKYSLPESIKTYLDEIEKNENEKYMQKMQKKNLFLLLQRFVEIAGDKWKEHLNLLLQSDDINLTSQLGKAFDDFMSYMIKMTQEEDEDIQNIQVFINNEVLLYLIDKYIEARL